MLVSFVVYFLCKFSRFLTIMGWIASGGAIYFFARCLQKSKNQKNKCVFACVFANPCYDWDRRPKNQKNKKTL
jgi:hypothetical protein